MSLAKGNQRKKYVKGKKKSEVPLLSPPNVPRSEVFISEPRLHAWWRSLRDVLPWWQKETLAFFFFSPVPVFPSPRSQALILLVSPRARRGVRVGSICLCDGHRCQAPRGWGAGGGGEQARAGREGTGRFRAVMRDSERSWSWRWGGEIGGSWEGSRGVS